MKKINFLAELFRNDKLDVVEPSMEIRQSYLEKARSNFESANILSNAGKFEEAISLAYYSSYNSVMALFFGCGIKCENHSAAIILLKEVFGLEKFSDILSSAKRERIDKQYYFDFSIISKQVVEFLEEAREFMVEMEGFIRVLSNEKINNIRKDLLDIVR